MHISYAPVLTQDASAILSVEESIGSDDSAARLQWPGVQHDAEGGMEAAKEQRRSATDTIREEAADERNIWVKAVDEDMEEDVEDEFSAERGQVKGEVSGRKKGKIVGYAWWQFVKGKTPEEWEKYYAGRKRPPTCNAALMDALGGARTLKRAKLLGDRDYFTLKELYIRPSHQNNGIGTELLVRGLKHADATGVVTYVEAMDRADKLYLRHGLVEKDRVDVHLVEYGGKDGHWSRWSLMTREPHGS